jgi:hypothetical protein
MLNHMPWDASGSNEVFRLSEGAGPQEFAAREDEAIQ